MFYLKYRPKQFSEVVGLTDIVHALQKALSLPGSPHAYLFCGPRGSGKTTMARLVAKTLNCLAVQSTAFGFEACSQCSSCQEVNQGKFLDLIEIDAASNRGIDDIRDLREKVKLAPSGGKYKVYIIDEVHMLTSEAFNALLKTLEEPPPHAVFILATTDPQKVPETIKSRCHVFNFNRASRESLREKINRIIESERLDLSPDKVEEIIQLSDGAFRDAETLLEQTVFGLNELESRGSQPSDFVDGLINGEKNQVLTLINELHSKGVNWPFFTQRLLYYLRDLMLVKSGAAPEILAGKDSDHAKMVRQSQELGEREISELLGLFIKAHQDFRLTPIPQLPLEMAVLSYFSGKGPVEEKVAEATKSSDDSEEESDPSSQSPVDSSDSSPSLEAVVAKWSEILKAVKSENNSLEALLRSARPLEVSKNLITIEVYYKFHKERLSTDQSLSILEKVFSRVLGVTNHLKCVLGESREKKDSSSEVSEARSSLGQELLPEDDVKAAALKAFVRG